MRRNMLSILLMTVLLAFAQDSTDKKAPDFVLPDLDGNNYRLSEHLGNGPVVINFWATWCIPCREELKKMKKIYRKYRDQGLEILAISIDDPKTVGRVKSFVSSHKYPFKILLDTNNEIIRLYQASTPPYTVLIDKQGNIVYTHLGYRRGDEKILERKIKVLLKDTGKK